MENSVADVEYKSWSNNDTKILIGLYKSYRNKVGSFELRNMKKLWERIAHEMNKKFNVTVTPSNCENRWRVVERNYKKYIDNNNKTGKGRKQFEYADEMDAIFQKRRNVYPELLLSSNTVDRDFDRTQVDSNATIAETQPQNQPGTPNASNNNSSSSNNDSSSSSRPNISDLANVSSSRKEKQKKFRSDILEDIRKDRVKYYQERLKLQKEQFERKMKLEEEKLKERRRKNDLIEQRNELLQQIAENNVGLGVNMPPDMY